MGPDELDPTDTTLGSRLVGKFSHSVIAVLRSQRPDGRQTDRDETGNTQILAVLNLNCRRIGIQARSPTGCRDFANQRFRARGVQSRLRFRSQEMEDE